MICLNWVGWGIERYFVFFVIRVLRCVGKGLEFVSCLRRCRLFRVVINNCFSLFSYRIFGYRIKRENCIEDIESFKRRI